MFGLDFGRVHNLNDLTLSIKLRYALVDFKYCAFLYQIIVLFPIYS